MPTIEERRATPLALKLQETIRRHGPLPVAAWARLCLQDPDHGYYRTQLAIGADGDFVTAPEISQVFGELIGLWCVIVWQQMGAPRRIHVVELGPGRGTLMRDALRAAGLVPAFVEAAQVTLLEASAPLRQLQQTTLADAPVPIQWRSTLTARDLPTAADHDVGVIVIGNEYLDLFCPRQYVFCAGRWRERCVKLDADGRLTFGILDPPLAPHKVEPLAVPSVVDRSAHEGDVFELWTDWGVMPELVGGNTRLAALLIDYGNTEPGFGDTLQAVRRHRVEHPLASPGEADLTAQVDFSQFAAHFGGLADLDVDGPVTQATFLNALGIVERCSRLMAANPRLAGEVEMGVARLIAPNGMGHRFKVVGLRRADLPVLPGFL